MNPNQPEVSPGRRRRYLLGAGLLVALVALAGIVFDRQAQPPTVSPSEVTAIAVKVQQSSAQVEGQSTAAAVVLVDPAGIGITALKAATSIPTAAHGAIRSPTPTLGILLANGTTVPARVVQDPVRGLSAIVAEGAPNLSALPLGSSAALRIGEQVVLSPENGSARIVVIYQGHASVRVGGSGFSQDVLDLQAPAGTAATSAVVLDHTGALVGIVVPDRQTGAPAGHLYAVPVEQAEALIQQAGQPTLVPLPTRTPVPPTVVNPTDAAG